MTPEEQQVELERHNKVITKLAKEFGMPAELDSASCSYTQRDNL